MKAHTSNTNTSGLAWPRLAWDGVAPANDRFHSLFIRALNRFEGHNDYSHINSVLVCICKVFAFAAGQAQRSSSNRWMMVTGRERESTGQARPSNEKESSIAALKRHFRLKLYKSFDIT